MTRIMEDKWSTSKEQGSGAVRMCYYSQIQQMLRVIKEFVKKGWLHAETTESKTLTIHKHYVLMKWRRKLN